MKRILLTLGLTTMFVVYVSVAGAGATPIRPDIRKLIAEPQQDTSAQAVPARAGWEGPEMPVQAQGLPLEGFSSDRLLRAERAELIAAATPDPRAILGIVAVIFLLRLLRRQDEKHPKPHMVPAAARENTEDRIAA